MAAPFILPPRLGEAEALFFAEPYSSGIRLLPNALRMPEQTMAQILNLCTDNAEARVLAWPDGVVWIVLKSKRASEEELVLRAYEAGRDCIEQEVLALAPVAGHA